MTSQGHRAAVGLGLRRQPRGLPNPRCSSLPAASQPLLCSWSAPEPATGTRPHTLAAPARTLSQRPPAHPRSARPRTLAAREGAWPVPTVQTRRGREVDSVARSQVSSCLGI